MFYHNILLNKSFSDNIFSKVHVQQCFQRVLPEGVRLWKRFFLFLFDEEMKDPNTTISGPTTARQRNVSLAGPMMANHWMLECKLCEFKGIRTSIAINSYIFVIFEGRVRTPCPPPPLDPHIALQTKVISRCH